MRLPAEGLLPAASCLARRLYAKKGIHIYMRTVLRGAAKPTPFGLKKYQFRAVFMLAALLILHILLIFPLACIHSSPAVIPGEGTDAPQTGGPEASPSPAAPTAAIDPTPTPTPTPTSSPTPAPSPTPDGVIRAVYTGIEGYGRLTAQEVQQDGARVYAFLSDGSKKLFAIKNDKDFTIQNMLMEGYEYELSVENDTVTEARLVGGLAESAPCPVSYTPGERTLKNLLSAAMQPLGRTLYVYGGGWSWQDDGASLLARNTFAPRSWRDFFLSQTADYTYKDEASPETSFYPFGGWCEYYYAGLDCSGYLGWTVYNTLESQSGGAGYVFKSTEFAKTLADMGLGAYSAEKLERGGTPLQSGDIVSFSGHTYVVLGRCEDGSLLILHSSPTASRTGHKGGGVQLSAIDPEGNGGMALELARRYTEKYFPEWYSRYENTAVQYSTYIDFERKGGAGFFRWSPDKSGLTDPDGILDMSAEEILSLLFGGKAE